MMAEGDVAASASPKKDVSAALLLVDSLFDKQVNRQEQQGQNNPRCDYEGQCLGAAAAPRIPPPHNWCEADALVEAFLKEDRRGSIIDLNTLPDDITMKELQSLNGRVCRYRCLVHQPLNTECYVGAVLYRRKNGFYWSTTKYRDYLPPSSKQQQQQQSEAGHREKLNQGEKKQEEECEDEEISFLRSEKFEGQSSFEESEESRAEESSNSTSVSFYYRDGVVLASREEKNGEETEKHFLDRETQQLWSRWPYRCIAIPGETLWCRETAAAVAAGTAAETAECFSSEGVFGAVSQAAFNTSRGKSSFRLQSSSSPLNKLPENQCLGSENSGRGLRGCTVLLYTPPQEKNLDDCSNSSSSSSVSAEQQQQEGKGENSSSTNSGMRLLLHDVIEVFGILSTGLLPAPQQQHSRLPAAAADIDCSLHVTNHQQCLPTPGELSSRCTAAACTYQNFSKPFLSASLCSSSRPCCSTETLSLVATPSPSTTASSPNSAASERLATGPPADAVAAADSSAAATDASAVAAAAAAVICSSGKEEGVLPREYVCGNAAALKENSAVPSSIISSSNAAADWSLRLHAFHVKKMTRPFNPAVALLEKRREAAAAAHASEQQQEQQQQQEKREVEEEETSCEKRRQHQEQVVETHNEQQQQQQQQRKGRESVAQDEEKKENKTGDDLQQQQQQREVHQVKEGQLQQEPHVVVQHLPEQDAKKNKEKQKEEASTRQTLVEFLTRSLNGDAVAAEYVLLALCSRRALLPQEEDLLHATLRLNLTFSAEKQQQQQRESSLQQQRKLDICGRKKEAGTSEIRTKQQHSAKKQIKDNKEGEDEQRERVQTQQEIEGSSSCSSCCCFSKPSRRLAETLELLVPRLRTFSLSPESLFKRSLTCQYLPGSHDEDEGEITLGVLEMARGTALLIDESQEICRNSLEAASRSYVLEAVAEEGEEEEEEEGRETCDESSCGAVENCEESGITKREEKEKKSSLKCERNEESSSSSKREEQQEKKKDQESIIQSRMHQLQNIAREELRALSLLFSDAVLPLNFGYMETRVPTDVAIISVSFDKPSLFADYSLVFPVLITQKKQKNGIYTHKNDIHTQKDEIRTQIHTKRGYIHTQRSEIHTQTNTVHTQRNEIHTHTNETHTQREAVREKNEDDAPAAVVDDEIVVTSIEKEYLFNWRCLIGKAMCRDTGVCIDSDVRAVIIQDWVRLRQSDSSIKSKLLDTLVAVNTLKGNTEETRWTCADFRILSDVLSNTKKHTLLKALTSINGWMGDDLSRWLVLADAMAASHGEGIKGEGSLKVEHWNKVLQLEAERRKRIKGMFS